KSMSVGDAAVYDNHALILVNRGHAAAADILALASAITDKVETVFGVRLQKEVEII
ncbi:MAG: UDP-N-acetylmuramate dehydrogenase, partial [Bacteroidales bacterium]|nr:UDP-N-acetylmuramate dehydrogenase [Bacteroidales bacterium]